MQQGDVLEGRFELLEVAGHGGMSTVFRARDHGSGEIVAVKVLPENRPTESERFAREARLLAELAHPGIVRYIASGVTSDGQPFLVMEWLEGETLARRLSQGRLPPEMAVAVVADVADALALAHGRGVVHRDVKPGNIFLLSGTRAKVLDFGIARLAEATVVLTNTGAILGTPMYMAPEQARGDRDLDARVDVFALGCVLFECLVGRPPFVGQHPAGVLAKILLEEAPRVSALVAGLPPGLDDLVDGMLAKRPEARPASAALLAAALRALPPAPGPLQTQAIGQRGMMASEQRLLSVVVVGGGPLDLGSGVSDATLALDGDLFSLLHRSVGAHGGHLERLADGSLVVTLTHAGVASDQVARAARCALALRGLLPERPIALGTGRGTLASATPVGEVIDRAVRLVAEAPSVTMASGSVWLDSVSASLLETAFDTEESAAGHLLRGEREQSNPTRTLLGRLTPCVGRDRELATLDAIMAESAAEPVARVVLLSGAAGGGKSRVRAELVQRVAQRYPGTTVLLSRGDPSRAGEPFSMVAQLVRRAAGISLETSPEEGRTRLLAATAAVEPAADRQRTAEFLGELLGLPFPDHDRLQLRAARASAIVMGDQMQRAFEDWLGAECERHAVLLVLEDLHWGDLPSVKFVDAALRNLKDRPLTVLAIARPEVHDLFPRLWSERGLEEIRLGELPRRAGERLVRTALGDDVAATLVANLVSRSGGNPFFLEELIRAAANGQAGQLPETVLAVLAARLDGLPPVARRLLRAGSIFGQRIEAAAVAFLLDEADVASVSQWLRVMAEQEMLTPVRDDVLVGSAGYAFRHALLRDTAYATLTDGDRATGHRLAAEWLEAHGTREPAALAEHWERGGEPLRAVSCYLRAASLALQGNDFTQAVERAARGEACGAIGEMLGELRLIATEAMHWQGEAAEAERLAEASLVSLPSGGVRALAAAGLLATAAGRLTHHERLEKLADELAGVPAVAAQGSALVSARIAVAVALCHAGKLDVADRLLELTAREADSSGADPVVTAWLHRGLAIRGAYAGDPAGSLRLMESSARAFEAAGDLRTACQQWGNVGFLMRELGLFDQAEAALRAVLVTAERLGLSHIVPTTQHNVGWALALQGDLASAAVVLEAAAAAFVHQQDHRFEGSTRIYLARIHLMAGDLDDAEREIAAATTLLASTPQSRAYALAVRAEICLRRGRDGEALAAAGVGLELLRQVGGTDEGEAFVYLAAARAMRASGDADEARTVLAEGLQRLVDHAARITDEAWREAFLRAVPDHAMLLAMASESSRDDE